MKVGLIYTSTTPELIELVEQEVKKQLGEDVELYSLQDPSVLADVREAGYVTTAPAARLIGMYMKAAEEGVDAMLNLCSSVGEVANSVQDVAKYIGVGIDPIILSVLITVVIGVGLVTPPVGMCIYVACDLMDVKVGDVFPTLIPFLLATFVCIALMIAFPQLITLPTALMRV